MKKNYILYSIVILLLVVPFIMVSANNSHNNNHNSHNNNHNSHHENNHNDDENDDEGDDEEEADPVDGGWSDWTPANENICGETVVQTRTCTNPSPANEGADCEGDSEQTIVNNACAPEVTTATVHTTKIICDSESDLPNWGDHKGDNDQDVTINSNTASDFLESHPTCHADDSWEFEWADDSVSNPGDNEISGGEGFTVFSNITDILAGKAIFIREKINSDYIPFTGYEGEDTSAEIYCSYDVDGYDNYEWVGLTAGSDYYCVAFNTLKETDNDEENNDEETPVDVCANIEGDQASVPEGMEITDGDQCTDIVVEQEEESHSGTTTGSIPFGYRGSNGGRVLGASTSSCSPYLTKYIQYGYANDAEEVKKLQIFLNEEFGLNLKVDGIYGKNTFNAVKKFQVKYFDDVLLPWTKIGSLKNNSKGTGFVYKTTLWKINEIKCPEANEPAPELN